MVDDDKEQVKHWIRKLTLKRFREAIVKKYRFYSHGAWSYEMENAILFYMAAGLAFEKSGVGIMMSHAHMKDMSFALPPPPTKKGKTAAQLRDKIAKFHIDSGKFQEPPEKLSKALLQQAIRSVEGVTDRRSVKDRIDWLLASGIIKHGDWSKEDYIIVYDAPPPPAAPPMPPPVDQTASSNEFDDVMKGYT
jgi:hypothetical protein